MQLPKLKMVPLDLLAMSTCSCSIWVRLHLPQYARKVIVRAEVDMPQVLGASLVQAALLHIRTQPKSISPEQDQSADRLFHTTFLIVMDVEMAAALLQVS